jgi:hypothetical protein
MTADLIVSRFVWFTVIMQVFSTLLKSEILSFSTIILISSANTNKKTAKAKYIVQFITQAVSLRIYWTIQAQDQKGINQNFDKRWASITLNFDTFYLRLPRLTDVKFFSNGWKGINFHSWPKFKIVLIKKVGRKSYYCPSFWSCDQKLGW